MNIKRKQMTFAVQPFIEPFSTATSSQPVRQVASVAANDVTVDPDVSVYMHPYGGSGVQYRNVEICVPFNRARFMPYPQ
jgi:hypothetical protein